MTVNRRNDRSKAGDTEIDSDGEIRTHLGGGLSIDSEGEVGTEIAPGVILEADGDIEFKLF